MKEGTAGWRNRFSGHYGATPAPLRRRLCGVVPTVAALIWLLAGWISPAGAVETVAFPLPDDASCLTSECHTDKGTAPHVHTAASTDSGCVMCHQIDQAGVHRFALPADDGALCGMCHGDIAGRPNQHTPVAMGMCLICHDPHQSEQPAQLRFPPGKDLCLTCHDPAGFTNKVTHGPVASGMCLSCHDPHGSEHRGNLTQAVPELCMACHLRDQQAPDGGRITALNPSPDDRSAMLHAPYGFGACDMCHTPHAGEHFRLLTGPYPESFYTAYSTDKYFCLTCHNPAAFETPRTLDDTGFRNGNLNLHYRHVNRDKGRTCRACHHHHGAGREALIRETVAFGNSQIPVAEFEKTDSGGRCAPACHREARYDRLEPINNPIKVTPREGKDATLEELQNAHREPAGDTP